MSLDSLHRLWRPLAMLALLSLSLTAGADAALTLVSDGVSQAPIVVFEGAPPRIRQAADELADYVERMSGARPDVLQGRPDPVPERAVWVGYQPVLDDLFPEEDFDFQHPEEILIVVGENHVAIAGRDRWHPDLPPYHGRRAVEHGVQQEYGTVNAVYTFLRDFLGVRWLWPGELGEDILHSPTIALEPSVHRYHPQIRLRSGKMIQASLGFGRSPAYEWMRVQRLQLDSMLASHTWLPKFRSFEAWWERYHETHPEFFALQPDGSRGTFPPREVQRKICQSNPGVWDQWIAEAETALEENPNARLFGAGINGYTGAGLCVCEGCLAWDSPEAETATFLWQDASQEYFMQADREVRFGNQLARKLRERYPDRDYFVNITAIGTTLNPPVSAVADENVMVTLWVHHLLRIEDDPATARYRSLIEGWSQAAPNIVWELRPSGAPQEWKHREGMLPGPYRRAMFDRVAEEFRYFADRNLIGVMFDGMRDAWLLDAPFRYLAAHLTWNPRDDSEAILEDFFRRGFGPGAEAVQAYWTLLGERYEVYLRGEHHFDEIYTPELFERLGALLDDAAVKVDGEPEIFAKRVAFVRDGLDFGLCVVRLRDLRTRYRDSDGQDADARQEARTEWERIVRLRTQYPDLMNWGHDYRLTDFDPENW